MKCCLVVYNDPHDSTGRNNGMLSHGLRTRLAVNRKDGTFLRGNGVVNGT